MLDECVRLGVDYHLRVDDDCWLSTRKWLRALLCVFDELNELKCGRASVGISISGLKNPPARIQGYEFKKTVLDSVDILGGIFRLTPMGLIRYFRWDERLPMGMGEARQFANFCQTSSIGLYRAMAIHASHGESTAKQEETTSWAFEHDMLQYLPVGL